MIKDIVRSKMLKGHFLLMFVGAFVTCGLLYILLIPLLYWAILGEGAAAERAERLPLNIFVTTWLSLILVLVAITIGFYKNIKEKNFPKAKSYLVIAIVITGLYLFRIQVGDLLIELSQ